MKKKRKRHSPEQIVKKLRDADVMLSTGKCLEEVLKMLEVSEATLDWWRQLVRWNEERGNRHPVQLAVKQIPFPVAPRQDDRSSSSNASHRMSI